MRPHGVKLPPHASPLLGLLVYLGASVVVGALLAFPVYELVQQRAEAAFDSVLHRVAALALLLLLPLYLYLASARGAERHALHSSSASARFGATSFPHSRRASTRLQAFGFGCSPHTFCRCFCGGFVLGVIVVSPLVAAFLVLGVRAPAQVIGSVLDVGAYLAFALLSAVIIGMIEEAYFRGALLAPLQGLSACVAVSIVSVVYAVVHFLGAPLPAETLSWSSGLSSIARSEIPLDAFLALVAAGLFLGALRYRFGHIAVGAGFHAGWVFMMKLNQEYTDIVPSSDWSFLEGTYGGTMGYLGLAWIVLLAVGWHAWERRSAPVMKGSDLGSWARQGGSSRLRAARHVGRRSADEGE